MSTAEVARIHSESGREGGPDRLEDGGPHTSGTRSPERVRVVTAASLFDGHDAAINIMRRILQAQGAEVIHLGHDRSVDEIADAARTFSKAAGVKLSPPPNFTTRGENKQRLSQYM